MMMLRGLTALVMCVAVVLTQDQQMQLSDANTRFALDTYQQLAAQGGNMFYSPLSLSIVMGMLYEGANGTTRAQMENVANFDQVRDLSASFRELTSVLNTPTKNTLRAANRIYAHSDYNFRPSYMQTMRKDYQSDVIPSDFVSKREQVRAQINDWVANSTNDKIKDLIPSGALDSTTKMVIVNAMYFKGEWLRMFEEAKTGSKKFYLSAADSVSTDMMYQKGKFRLTVNPHKGYKAIELPYNGREISMFIVLPDAVDGLAEVEKQMTFGEVRNMHRALRSAQERDVMLTLPKFKIEQEYKMKDHLSAMGLDTLFDQVKCDLSGMDGTRRLYASEMFHKCFVDVNEKGSEAAAATGVVINSRGFIINPNQIFKADHPFLFYIKDNRNDAVLFMGRYVKP